KNVCNLCGSSNFREFPVIYTFTNCKYNLIQCCKCNLITVSPMPSPETIRSFYSDEYFKKDYQCGIKTDNYYAEGAATIQKANQVLPLLKKLKPKGVLLEIGCAGGTFLDQASKNNYEVEGVEVSSSMSEKASELYGVKVRQGDFEKLEFMDGSFDIVCMFDVFEHLREPKQALAKIYRILKSNGIVVIDIPTTKNALAFKLSTKILEIAKKTRGISSPPYHLYEYLPSTLQRFLRLTNFELCKVKKYTTPPWRYLNEDGSRIKKLMLCITRYFNYLLSISFKVYTDRLLVIAQK
ncbi:MAG: class I SAM-dependent methyltransferase, partial [candidate division Zixibacteria bacterium]|nr:class I SAM-dependent methyltransferase [candidate division Zixibacteria bacterium]